MHRACVNQALPPTERLLRQRVWRTMYIQDRFNSAALGRPMSIHDEDWDDSNPTTPQSVDRLGIEMVRISCIIGDICRQVYRPRTISSDVASTLARRLHEWSNNLPADMTVDSLLRNEGTPARHRHILQC